MKIPKKWLKEPSTYYVGVIIGGKNGEEIKINQMVMRTVNKENFIYDYYMLNTEGEVEFSGRMKVIGDALKR